MSSSDLVPAHSGGSETDEQLRYEHNEFRCLLETYFDEVPGREDIETCEGELETISEIVSYVESRASSIGYLITLSKSFLLLAQRVSVGGPQDDYNRNLTEEDIFDQYERTDNAEITLTLVKPDGTGDAGIRRTEEELVSLYNDLGRTGIHGSPPHSSENWSRFSDLLLSAFKLSLEGRLIALWRLFDFGLEHLIENTAYAGNEKPRLFESVIDEYPRGSVPYENGGMVFQGIAYGYFKADRPHLSLAVDKVRTGSSRQRRIGDIDGYLGEKVELSIEVKDKSVGETERTGELSSFVELARSNKIHGLVVAREISNDAHDHLEADGIRTLDEEQMLAEVRRWDWPKQDVALLGLIHYIAHVEQNPKALLRLQEFLHDLDEEHDTVENFEPSS